MYLSAGNQLESNNHISQSDEKSALDMGSFLAV